MADNVTLDPGSGGSVIRTKDRTAVETQIVALDINPSGSEVLQSAAALADGTSNPTTAPWAGMLMCFNGTTWDRLRGDTTNGAWVNVKATAAPASLPLPTGASTAAKQPALGTAGSASSDVLTVQGIASMTALKVDGSAVTQPVSGTVTANAGTGVFHVDDNSGSLTVDNAGTFAVQDSEKIADNAGFTDGTSKVMPSGYILDETAGTALTENDVGAARIDSKRAQVLVIEDSSTRGQRASVTASNALKVDGSAVTQPVSGTVVVSGVSSNVTVQGSGIGLGKGSSSNAYQKVKYAAQTTTVQTVKGSAGVLAGWFIYNPNASAAYVQIFDTASAVTLGTTAPDIILPVPAGSAANVFSEVGVGMSNGIKLACTTTATGSSAPATGLDMTVFYG